MCKIIEYTYTHAHVLCTYNNICTGLKNEGWFDPWLFLNAFKKKAISQGVHYLDGEITGMDVEDNMVKSVQVHTCGVTVT